MTFRKFLKGGLLALCVVLVSCAAFDSDSKKSSIVVALPSSSSRTVQMVSGIVQYYAVVANFGVVADFSSISGKSYNSYLRVLRSLDSNLVAVRGTPGSSIEIADLEEGDYAVYLFALDSSNAVSAWGCELSARVKSGESTAVSILLSWTDTSYITVALSNISSFAEKISELETDSSIYDNIYIRFTGAFSSDGSDSTSTEITAIREALSDSSVKKSYAIDFSGTTGLTSLKGTADSTDTFFTGAVFYGCSSIEAIVLPASLSELGNAPFANCSSLQNIFVASGSRSFVSRNGVLYSSDGTALLAYPVGRLATSFSIPATVKKIGNSAFYGAMNLETIKFPEKSALNDIRFCAFRNTPSLKSIEIPDSVTQLQDYVFRDSGIESVTISKNIITMGCVFRDCKNLSSIIFADSSNWYYTTNKVGVWNGIRDGTTEPTEQNLIAISVSDLTPKNICEKGGSLYKAYFYHGDLLMSAMMYDFTRLKATDFPTGFFVEKDSSGAEVVISDNSTIAEKSSTGIVMGTWNFGGTMLYSRKNLAFKFYPTTTGVSELRFNGDSISEIASNATSIPIKNISRFVAVPTYKVEGQVSVRYGVSRGSSATQDSGVIALLDQDGNILAKNEGLTLTTSQKGLSISAQVTSKTSYVVIVFSRNYGGGGSLRIMGIDTPRPNSLGALDLSESTFVCESDGSQKFIQFDDENSAHFYTGTNGKTEASKTDAAYSVSGNQVIVSLKESTTEAHLVFNITFDSELTLVSESGDIFKRYYEGESSEESGSNYGGGPSTYGDGKESQTGGQIVNFSIVNYSIKTEFSKIERTETYDDGTSYTYMQDILIAKAYDSSGKEVTDNLEWHFGYYSLGDEMGLGWEKNVANLYTQDGSYQIVVSILSDGIVIGDYTIYFKAYEGTVTVLD